MTFIAKGRLSDSPYVDSIWQGSDDDDHTLMCPADGRWNLCFTNLNGKVQVSVEGPISQAIPLQHDVAILDVVDQLGYADQPHLTRSMKRFMGYTPTQVMGWRLPM